MNAEVVSIVAAFALGTMFGAVAGVLTRAIARAATHHRGRR